MIVVIRIDFGRSMFLCWFVIFFQDIMFDFRLKIQKLRTPLSTRGEF